MLWTSSAELKCVYVCFSNSSMPKSSEIDDSLRRNPNMTNVWMIPPATPLGDSPRWRRSRDKVKSRDAGFWAYVMNFNFVKKTNGRFLYIYFSRLGCGLQTCYVSSLYATCDRRDWILKEILNLFRLVFELQSLRSHLMILICSYEII